MTGGSTATIDGGRLPRLEFEELAEPVRSALLPKVERLGYLGEFFAVAGHEPTALGAFVEFTESLSSALPARWHHLIALAVATALGNDYERCQHEQRCVVLGMPPEWVRAAETPGRPGEGGVLDEDEVTLQRLALGVVSRDHDEARERFAELLGAAGPRLAVAALLMISRYVAHAAVTMTVGIESPVPSIFEGDSDG